MQIDFLINSLNGGGAEKLTLQLQEAFPGARLVLLENIIDYPVEKEALTLLEERAPAQGVLKYLRLFPQARRFARETQRTDLVVASLLRAFLVAWLAKLFWRGPDYVCWVHNDTKAYARNPVVAWLYRRIFGSARWVVVNSEKANQDLKDIALAPPDRVKTIYNFFPLEEIQQKANQPVAASLGEKGSPTLVVLGRLHPAKGHKYLIPVMAALRKDFPDLRVICVGDGSERAAITAQISAYELEDTIDLVGFQANPYPLVAQSDLLLSTSLSEGFGNVLVEGIICGVPVLSTDIDSGPREILAPDSPDPFLRTRQVEMAKFGVLLPAFSPEYKTESEEVWVHALRDFLMHPDKLTPYRNFPPEVCSRFSFATVFNQWQQLLTTSPSSS